MFICEYIKTKIYQKLEKKRNVRLVRLQTSTKNSTSLEREETKKKNRYKYTISTEFCAFYIKLQNSGEVVSSK